MLRRPVIAGARHNATSLRGPRNGSPALLARMQPSAIRGNLNLTPDSAALHPGYACFPLPRSGAQGCPPARSTAACSPLPRAGEGRGRGRSRHPAGRFLQAELSQEAQRVTPAAAAGAVGPAPFGHCRDGCTQAAPYPPEVMLGFLRQPNTGLLRPTPGRVESPRQSRSGGTIP